MTILEDKAWYLSKSMYAALIILGCVGYELYTGNPVPIFVFGLANALGIYGIRKALGEIIN